MKDDTIDKAKNQLRKHCTGYGWKVLAITLRPDMRSQHDFGLQAEIEKDGEKAGTVGIFNHLGRMLNAPFLPSLGFEINMQTKLRLLAEQNKGWRG